MSIIKEIVRGKIIDATLMGKVINIRGYYGTHSFMEMFFHDLPRCYLNRICVISVVPEDRKLQGSTDPNFYAETISPQEALKMVEECEVFI